MARYTTGDKARLSATFRNDAGDPADPGEVTILVVDPLGGETTSAYQGGAGAVTKASTGVFQLEVPLPISGLWRYRAEGTAPVEDVMEGTMDVRSDLP